MQQEGQERGEEENGKARARTLVDAEVAREERWAATELVEEIVQSTCVRIPAE